VRADIAAVFFDGMADECRSIFENLTGAGWQLSAAKLIRITSLEQ